MQTTDTNLSLRVSLLLAFVLVLISRLPFFAGVDFPLNDGALFLVMSEAILQSGFTLPDFISFNGRQIPFAYPPLSFFIASGVSESLSVPLIDVFTWLPLIVSVFSVVPTVILFRRFSPSTLHLFFAIACFCAVCRSFEWIVMGGGISRSFGQFFFLTCSALLVSSTSLAARLGAGACAGLAFCCHPEWGVNALVSCVMLGIWAGEGSTIARVKSVVLLLGVSAVVIAPWLSHVLTVHGFSPFLAARATAGVGIWDALRGVVRTAGVGVESGMGPIICWAAIWGMFSRVRRGDFFLLLWHVALLVATPRHGATLAALTVSLFAADSFSRLVETVPGSLTRWFARLPLGALNPANLNTVKRPYLFFEAVLCALVLGYFVHAWSAQLAITPAVALKPAERDLMLRVKELVPPGEPVVVVSPSSSWDMDRYSEWFSVIAQRPSILTVQGTEWLPKAGFTQLERAAVRVKSMTNMKMTLVSDFISDLVERPHYLVVFNLPGNPITRLFENSPHYLPLLLVQEGGIYAERKAGDLGRASDSPKL
jgi:hypothetical protein